MDDLMLERLLERAPARTVYPTTPALRGRVMSALGEAPPRPTPLRHPALAVAGLAILLLAAVAVTLAIPSSRSAIAEFFGVEGSKIERLPTPAAGITPTPLPTSADIGVYARPSTLADAAAALGFAPVLVGGEREPEVYVARYPAEAVVILRYPRFDVWEMGVREFTFGKGLPEGVVARDTAVGGRPASWIAGGPHVVQVFDSRGVIPGSERTVERDTLIWRTDVAFYRMETTLALADALRVAETLP